MAQSSSSKTQADIAPVDVLVGLGGTDRDLLATFLALSDDSKLRRRMTKQVAAISDKAKNLWESHRRQDQNNLALLAPSHEEIQQETRELSERQAHWQHSVHSDDMLRLLLWIRLREALDLPAQLTTTRRGCHHLADDMVARLLHVLDSPRQKKSSYRLLQKFGRNKDGGHDTTLSDIVVPIVDELLSKDETQDTSEGLSPDADQRYRELAEAVSLLGGMKHDQLQHVLDGGSINDINDDAMRNALMLGGSMSAVGVGVGVSGFAPYLLAAQASAFLPLISGPGLVSFVSVISNPVTIVLVTATGGAHFVKKAEEKSNAHIASHIMAILALTGLRSGRQALHTTLQSFALAPHLPDDRNITDRLWGGQKTIDGYKAEWQRLTGLANIPDPRPSAETEWIMSHHLAPGSTHEPTPRTTTGSEHGNLAAMTGLTLGDMLYNLAAIEPKVIQAADFSRSADIESTLDFATLAEQIQNSSQAAILGATSQLKGYVAEQAVAAQLVAQGHTVSLAETANNPGWDLLVDGQPMQVKFHDGLGGLREHFAHYDIPVIANTELSDQIPAEWSNQVFFLDGLSNSHIEALTTQSLDAGAEVFSPDVMPAAAMITVTRSVLAYHRGQLNARQTFEQILLDGSVRVGLAGAGGIAGSVIGGSMFGPAGALVFGTGGPILAQTLTPKVSQTIQQRVSGEQYRQWQTEAHDHLDTLHRRLLQALSDKREQIDTKLVACPDTPAGDYLRWRLNDDRRHTQEVQIHLRHLHQQETPKAETRMRATLELLASAGLHPAHYQAELISVTEHFGQRPSWTDTAKDWSLAATRGAAMGTVAAKSFTIDLGTGLWRGTRNKNRSKNQD